MQSHVHRTRLGERMAYRVFGQGPRTLLCIHGLYRNGHDFDFLAQALAEAGFRVVTPDMIGRGDSDYATDPSRYNLQEYVQDILDLTRELGLERYDYLGTSMGGMVGMALAAHPASGIRRLILNDVGPEIALATLKDIGQRSLEAPSSFSSREEIRRFYRAALVSWGELSEAQFEHLVRHGTIEQDGRWGFRYDRDLIKGFRWPPGDIDLWPVYRSFTGPVLVFRGADSQVLTAATAERLRLEPNTQVIEVPGAGHAPSLMRPEQIAAIRRFLEG